MDDNAKKVEINTVDEYKNGSFTILGFDLQIENGQQTVKVFTAKRNTSPNVAPQTGCVMVIDGYSVSKRSIYELSPLKMYPSLVPGTYRVVGYCAEDNLDSVKSEFLRLAKESSATDLKELKRLTASVEASIQSML